MPETVAAGLRLAPDALTRPFEPSQFAFKTTDELEPFLGVLGQERAVEALQFGVAMPRPGYNVYVMGEPGTGRFSFVRRYLKAEGKRVATPSDWLYVNNFDEPREPPLLRGRPPPLDDGRRRQADGLYAPDDHLDARAHLRLGAADRPAARRGSIPARHSDSLT